MTQVEPQSKQTRITLDHHFTVLVKNAISKQWPNAKSPDNLMGKSIEVRGWLSRRKKQVQLRLQHESNLRVITH